MACDCPSNECRGEFGVYDCRRRIDDADRWLLWAMSINSECSNEADYIRRRLRWLEGRVDVLKSAKPAAR